MLPCTPPIASALPRLDLSPWLKYVCSRLNCNFTNNNKKIRLTIRRHSNYHWELPIILTTTTLMTIIIVTFSTSCRAMVGSPSALFTSSLSWPHSVWHLHKKRKKHQYPALYQNWNRTSVYLELAVSASYHDLCWEICHLGNVLTTGLSSWTSEFVTIGGSPSFAKPFAKSSRPTWFVLKNDIARQFPRITFTGFLTKVMY